MYLFYRVHTMIEGAVKTTEVACNSDLRYVVNLLINFVMLSISFSALTTLPG